MALLESSLFLAGAEALNTPGLIFFLERIEQNLAAVLRMVHGQADRLRPHVKTHKTREISRLWMALGVKKHKAATLVEAEMLAQEGAEDVLVSYPLVGPAPGALAVLAGAYSGTRFSALVDGWETLKGLQEAANTQRCQLGVMVDLDVGQHRTGVGRYLTANYLSALCCCHQVLHANKTALQYLRAVVIAMAFFAERAYRITA